MTWEQITVLVILLPSFGIVTYMYIKYMKQLFDDLNK